MLTLLDFNEKINLLAQILLLIPNHTGHNKNNCLILAVIFIARGLKDAKDAKKGRTIEDERSRKVSLLAGAKSFKYSMWYLLILMWLSSVMELIPMNSEIAFGAGILGMAAIYGITWIWANKQEDLDQAVGF